MRRPLVTIACVWALSLAPALLVAQSPQQPPAQQPPTQQPAQQTPAQTPQPKEPSLALTSQAAALLVQIKPGQETTFEELLGKVKEALGKSENPVRKQQLAGWKVYKAAEPMGGNVLYVFVIDPAVKGAEYGLLQLLAEGMGAEAAKPENQELFKKYVDAFAAGINRLNLTPVPAFGGPM
jgi:hypothetical protein